MHYVFLILYIIALCAGLSLVPPIQRWWRHWQQARRITLLPIDQLPDVGAVAITGHTHPDGEPLTAPLSSRPCVYWHIVLREQIGRNSPTTLSDRNSGHPFRLCDGDQCIWIQPAHATFTLRGPDHHAWVGNDPVILEQLAQKGAIARRWGKNNLIIVSEICLPVGETVWVYGAVRTTATGKVVAGSTTTPLLISNRPPQQLQWEYGCKWVGTSALLLALLLAITLLFWWNW